MTLSTSNAQLIASFATDADLQNAHIKAGLAARDCFYLTTNVQTERGRTAAEDYTARTGKPYTGRHGHVSID